MEWKKCNLDELLVPLGFLIVVAYNIFLWYKVQTQPHTTFVGFNAKTLHNWVSVMMKENEKKGILAVQSLRNTIMASTLMATASILLSCGMAAVISTTYSVKKPLNDSIYGAHGEFMVYLKYVSLLTIFMASFFCYFSSVRFTSQVNILINVPHIEPTSNNVTPVYVTRLLHRGFVLNTMGNRLFYMGLPILLWIFGPVPVLLGSFALVAVLYNLDFACSPCNSHGKGEDECECNENVVPV